MENICQHCSTTFKNLNNLKVHLKCSKKCLKLRGIKIESKYNCKGCNSIFMNKINLSVHQDSCIFLYKNENEELLTIIENNNTHIIELNEKLSKLHENELSIKQLQKELKHFNDLKIEHKMLQKQYDELLHQHEKTIAKLEMKISQCDSFIQGIVTERFNSFNNEAVIEIDNEEQTETETEEDYKLQPLDLGDNLYIENREDGYINITNLCKAGNKEFKHWNSLEKTKPYLKELSRSVGIPTDLLIQSVTGGKNEDRKTWVHPYVAINIAQWISPQFDVKVSSWIYEVMLTGKIDISKTKSFQQLRVENKEYKLRIQYLTKKYVKLQPRIQYNEKNVIYVLTTPSHKKEGKYILGKATNLTNRLSTYNKTDEHEVVYYQECPDEDTMTMAEQVVFQRLKDYREQANRERFILPENRTIELFINVIKKTIEFLNDNKRDL